MLVLLLVGAVITDLYKHKIYNTWVLPGLAAGIIRALAAGGPEAAKDSAICAALAFFILFPVYLAGGIGAGDVKLFAAASSFLTINEVFICITVSFFLGAVISLIKIAAKKDLHQTIRFAVPVLISVLFIYGGRL